MKRKIAITSFFLLFIISGCGVQKNRNETQSTDFGTIEIEESKTKENSIELPAKEVNISTDKKQSNISELRKTYDITEADRDYQLIIHYVNVDEKYNQISYAELSLDGVIVQKINFEEYNAKEKQKSLSKSEMGLYENPLENHSEEFVQWKDYNFDGNLDFSIVQELYGTNYSDFIFLWNKETKMFEFMMRGLQVSNNLDEETEKIILDVDGGRYTRSEYYGVDEKGKLRFEKLKCKFWDADNLPFDTIEWTYVETEESVKANELISNENMWNHNDTAINWLVTAEKMVSEWNKDTAVEKGYFTVSGMENSNFRHQKKV